MTTGTGGTKSHAGTGGTHGNKDDDGNDAGDDDGGATDAGDAGASKGHAAKPCKGKPGMLRGKSNQMLMAGGVQRTFIHYAPDGLDPNKPAPTVILAHGYLMNGQGMYDITQYKDIADREKIVLLFPDGQDTMWNVGNPTCSSSILGVLPLGDVDDQAFVDGMLEFVEADQCVDHDHVFMTGFSMGGYFTNASGCERPDLAAIAPHSGGSYELTSCKSKRKPALIMHFNGDELIPTMCGQEARDRWVALNGCQKDSPDIHDVKGGRCEYYKACPSDGQVVYCNFDIPTTGMRDEPFSGHAWSGGAKIGDSEGFAIPETESASELTWTFFKKYAW